MKELFETYRPRKIEFLKLLRVEDWNIKVYTITNRDRFESKTILSKVLSELPYWIRPLENSTLPTYKSAFLIVHEAREGVWVLLNWWTGGEMIETKIYFAAFEKPDVITDSPYPGSALVCIWELEIFAHERAAWIRHVLCKADERDFENYNKDVPKYTRLAYQ